LWTEQNPTSPNLIGGYSGNWVTSGVKGATIGGGGESGHTNRVTDDYGTVGGGYSNQAGNADADTTNAKYATVGGGIGNEATDYNATVGGGAYNEATGPSATVGGGWYNEASGGSATVGGGWFNDATASSATVGGGGYNRATAAYATIAGGGGSTPADGNRATDDYGTVGGGLSNQVGNDDADTTNARYATIGGGYYNLATASASTVPGGRGAAASLYGQMAYASGMFANTGDAQFSLYVMRREGTFTTGNWFDLYLDGVDDLLTISSGRTLTFDILIVGRSDGGESAGYKIYGVIENVGGTTSLIASAVTTMGEDDDAWNARVVADDTNDALLVQVMGNGENIRWVAVVRTAEVSW
jgi:hypothetical protein